ncbi:hypothetical protein M513_09353 [Trichuris suis]|uniref:Integrase catalytic domain-containing protein n=1 Tax=Trichuris suis TaxID=68888 RepID=A0A085LXR2_9BILA|nr:hypothetical protein M513_09353 [Trichuris suis]
MVNPAIVTDVYPLPTLDEAFAALAGGKCFTKLDLRNAYLQVPVDQASADILTINTTRGLHRHLMISLLKDIRGVEVLLEDILITGSPVSEHWARVYVVLQRLKQAGLRLKSAKCIFAAQEVAFLDHKINSVGIFPMENKVKAIKMAPALQTITCDASSIGIGVVLSHMNVDGSHEPIYFASRVFHQSETNYAQVDREGLAVVFAVQKFRCFVLGLLQQGKPIKDSTSARLTRWSLLLSNYDYKLCYRPGKLAVAADILSWLPLDDDSASVDPLPPEVFMLEVEPHGPVSPDEIARAAAVDPVLSRPPWHCANKGDSSLIMWWPGMAPAIEAMVSRCSACQPLRQMPPKVSVHPWLDEEIKQWSRLHIDFAGPFREKYLFVAIDSAGKWPGAKIVPNMSTLAATKCLREVFETHGLPRLLVSDNGPAFTSSEFRSFVKRCGIKHLYTLPYHPSSNGQAERAIQALKQSLRKLLWDSSSFSRCLSDALFTMRTTPNRSTGRSPATPLYGLLSTLT